MTYFPVKVRSEFVSPMNSFGGGVCESTLRFQVASPASNWPALSPIRGSGLGGVGDMLPALDVEWAQPATTTRPSRRNTDRSDARAMTVPCGLRGAGGRKAGEHLLHAGDLGGLSHVHVTGE